MPTKYAEVATHAEPPKIAPAIIAMNGTFAPQGIKVVVMIVILTVTLIFNGTRSHDTGDTAAGTDQHRDKGLTGQTELTEDTVQNECDTRHITASLQECKEEEQYQHLRNETKNCADTGNDTIHESGRAAIQVRLQPQVHCSTRTGIPGTHTPYVSRIRSFQAISSSTVTPFAKSASVCSLLIVARVSSVLPEYIFSLRPRYGCCKMPPEQLCRSGCTLRTQHPMPRSARHHRIYRMPSPHSLHRRIHLSIFSSCVPMPNRCQPSPNRPSFAQSVAAAADRNHRNIVYQEHDNRERSEDPANGWLRPCRSYPKWTCLPVFFFL